MQQEIKHRGFWLLLICTGLTGFALEIPMFCVPPIAHIITKELLLSNAQVGLIFSIPTIILAAVAIPSGALADRIGIHKAAGTGVILIVLGSILRGISTDFLTLLAFTCLYGVGFGMVFPNLPKLIGTFFPHDKIGLGTGIYTTGIVFGYALALTITVPVVLPISNTFQGVFYIWTIPAAVAALMWWIVVKEPHPSNAQSQRVDQLDRPSYRIWSNSTLWLIAVLLSIINFIVFAWFGWTSQLMMAKGASPTLAAFMASLIAWVTVPLNFGAPYASDKIGLRKPCLWLAFILFILAPLGAIYVPLSLGWVIVAAVGVAAGTSFPILLALPIETVPPVALGRASGMVLSIGFIGGVVGPWITGYILDITGNLNLGLIILSGVAAVGIYLVLRLPETGTRARLCK